MALTRLAIDGYGQIELNQVAFRRDGRIEAQCKLDATDFADVPIENGMIVAVDNITRTVKFAKDMSFPVALNYSTEHMYDERKPGLKNFSLTKDEFLPRLGYFSIQDKFTTNCVCYDTTEFADEDAFITALKAYDTTRLYGGISEIGAIKVSATKPTDGPVLAVIAYTTMPDGQKGIKFQCYAE